jgi:DNA polymerase III alpha subunit (gram-positive type)
MTRRYVILDIETDDLNATVIHVVVTKDFTTGERRHWTTPDGLAAYLDGAILVGHNILWFDVVVLNALWHLGIDPERCIDTLVVSRLINSWDYSQHGLPLPQTVHREP